MFGEEAAVLWWYFYKAWWSTEKRSVKFWDCGCFGAHVSSSKGIPTRKSKLLSSRDLASAKHSSLSKKPRIPSPYIEYRSLSSLLEDFRTRLGGFLQAHSYHFMCNNTSKNGVDGRLPVPPRAAIFEFDGEFSVVALDLDVPGRKADVEGEVLRLKGEVERLGRIQFR